jgi:hypothetical protein
LFSSLRRTERRAQRVLVVCALVFALWAVARGETIVLGTVVDATTKDPVPGATVAIRRGNTRLGYGATDTHGSFRFPIDVGVTPVPQQLVLAVEHDGYAGTSKIIAISGGRTDSPEYDFEVLPKALAACLRNRDHALVVGYFRPPVAGGPSDLAPRIADALSYGLLTRLQQLRLAPEEQPFVLVCSQAQPQASSDSGALAKALHADAFLFGYVAPADGRFKVEMTVADRFDLLVPPTRASSPDVDLDDPAAARLDPRVHEAILTALIAGYARADRHAECVEVTVAAERILGSLPPVIADARRRCQDALRNRGLLREGTP